VARKADGTCPVGTLPGTDAGNARCFVVDTTDVDAARRMIHTMMLMGLANGTQREKDFHARSEGIRVALASGDPKQLAHAMKLPASVAYYEAPEETYAKLLSDVLTLVDREVPRSTPLPLPPPPASKGPNWLGLGLLGGFSLLGYRWWKRRRG
jgi:hypothetical protein